MRVRCCAIGLGLLVLATLGSIVSAEEPAEARRDVRIAMCQIFALESDREGNFDMTLDVAEKIREGITSPEEGLLCLR